MLEIGAGAPLSFRIPLGDSAMKGELCLPPDPFGLAVIAHGTGSGIGCPRNRSVARLLRDRGFGTLLIDCPSTEVIPDDAVNGGNRQLRLLEGMARSVEAACEWLREQPSMHDLAVGYLGSGLGGGAILKAAADRPDLVSAVVARGARPECVADLLHRVTVPTLMVVGSRDLPVLTANREALDRVAARLKKLEIVPGAGHMFQEPGVLAAAALHAANWFALHLADLGNALVFKRDICSPTSSGEQIRLRGAA